MKNTVLVLLFLLSVLACSKDRLIMSEGALKSPDVETELPDTTGTQSPGTGTKLPEFTKMTVIPEELKRPAERVTINSEKDIPFITKNGTEIYIGPYNFNRLPDGGMVTYPFRLEVIELLSVKDIILHEKPTVSNGRLLTTDGQIFIKAFKDDKELLLNRYSSAMLKMSGINKGQPDPEMRIFVGEETENGFNWLQDSLVCGGPEVDYVCPGIGIVNNNYIVFPSGLDWINIDKFVDYDQTTVLKFESEANLNFIKTFLYFPDINSILQVSHQVSYQEEPFLVPVGFKAKVIAFVFNEDEGEKLYAYFEDIVIKPDHVINIVLSETTKEELIQELDKLP